MSETTLIILACFFVLLTGFSLLLWGYFFERKWFEINKHSVFISKSLPRPLKILHLSDIHFCKPDAALSEFFDRLGQETFDLIFISGDIIDRLAGVPICFENLKKIKSRIATVAVLGNHDHAYYDPLDLILHSFPWQEQPKKLHDLKHLESSLSELGIRLLKNETMEISHEGCEILIHGLDDPVTGHARLECIQPNFNPTKINFLLTHSIDVFRQISDSQIDLSFSGHSHGGQIRLPFFGAVVTHTRMGRRFASGIHHHKGAVCSVSRGMGTSRFLPVRLFCRPEAIVLTLAGK